MEADFAFVVLFVGGFMLGMLRGAVRQLVALGAWLVTFVVAAYVRVPFGDWLAGQWREYSLEYVHMLAFVISFLVLFGLALAIVEIGGTTIELSRRPIVDDLVGGLLMLGVTVLAVASVLIALDTYYAASPPPGANEVAIVHDFAEVLERSAISRALHESLIPGLQALLGPLLPADVRSAG